jgi:hypothetical protein
VAHVPRHQAVARHIARRRSFNLETLDAAVATVDLQHDEVSTSADVAAAVAHHDVCDAVDNNGVAHPEEDERRDDA